MGEANMDVIKEISNNVSPNGKVMIGISLAAMWTFTSIAKTYLQYASSENA